MATDEVTTRRDDDPRILVEVWEDSYEVGTDQEEAATRLVENHGGMQVRTAVLTVRMAPPQYAAAGVDMPDDVGHVVDVSSPTAAKRPSGGNRRAPPLLGQASRPAGPPGRRPTSRTRPKRRSLT